MEKESKESDCDDARKTEEPKTRKVCTTLGWAMVCDLREQQVNDGSNVPKGYRITRRTVNKWECVGE